MFWLPKRLAWVTVNAMEILVDWPWGVHNYGELRGQLRDFIINYDNGKQVEPFEFTL